MENLIEILIRAGPYKDQNSRGDTVSAMIKSLPKNLKKTENFEIYTL